MTEPLNNVTAMAHAQPGLPVGEVKTGHEPLDFELAIPAHRRLRRPAGRLLDPDPNTPAGGAGGFPDD
ncbi:hypothetical protein [Streptomyces morookaense]|uniref:Uncharacterized protein n=1 Tax=Streptomyces morookaense TaxID=1970 RepID=A0A7Y7E8R8_STRMO|nr:hypothetical protein [Streptomyces morookaense]NVK80283.1 hypothetical protein [Streptomyces morookaense]GHF39967.1 hypothetical protein GCM10010359_48170 [Streptomyces morookaense]